VSTTLLPKRVLAGLGIAVLLAGCAATTRHADSTTSSRPVPAVPSTTAPAPTSVPPTTTSTVPYSPPPTLPPPTTTTTAALVTCSLGTLESEMNPACQQTIGRDCTIQEAEQFGQEYYGCQEFTP
jgi:hypothetical protein